MKPLVAALFSLGLPVLAQTGTITTVAGGGVDANSVYLGSSSMAADSAGSVYLPGVGQLFKVSAAGVVSAIALPPGTNSGGTTIKCLAVDMADAVYYCDALAHDVKKVVAPGVVATVASGIDAPVCAAFDAAGNLYVGDGTTRRILKVSGSSVTVVAGNGATDTTTLGGPATSASIGIPYAIVTDNTGGLSFISGGAILHVDAGGLLTRLTGSLTSTARAVVGGPGSDASFVTTGFTIDGAGNIYIASFMENKVFRVDASDVVHDFAGVGPGGPTGSYGGDGGPATAAHLWAPWAITRDSLGNTYIADTSNGRVRKVDAAGTITSLRVGTAYMSGDGGPAAAAMLQNPVGVSPAADGSFDIVANRIRHVDATGSISSVSLYTPLSLVTAVARDAAGNLYESELSGRVLKIDPLGVISPGLAATASLNQPRGLAFDAAGNLFVADTGNRVVRKFTPAGVTTVVAGSGAATFLLDGVPATSSGMTPWGLAFDGAGNLLIADSASHRVLRVDGAGVVRSIAGTGSAGFGPDGALATASALNAPMGVAVDPSGNVYIADGLNHRVRVIGGDGRIATFAGTGVGGFNGNSGAASSMMLNSPSGVTWDPAGALLIADTANGRVRRAIVVASTPNPFTFPPQAGVAVSSLVQSQAIVPAGYSADATVSVTGGEYSIGCSGVFASVAGTLHPGDSICVRHTSAAINNMDAVTTLSLGGTAATFTSTTVPGPGAITLSSTALGFGGQSMFTTSQALVVTLTNAGSGPVSVNAAVTAAPFAAVNGCATIAAGAMCEVSVTFTPTTDLAFSGALTLQNSPGTQTVALSGRGERSLTTHYYRAILGRTPDAAGQVFWNSEAARLSQAGVNVNEAWYAMAQAFFFSPEYIAFNRDGAGYLADLYRTFFNRVPDTGGFAYWSDQLQRGMPREVVLVSFMLSPEFVAFSQAIFGNTAARAEVDTVMDFYRGLLARLPETEGLQFWVGRFRAAQCAGSSSAAAVKAQIEAISSAFTTGTEYTARNRSNGQYVGDLYNAFYRRGGDLGGVQNWIMQLDDRSLTREAERQLFLITPEFGNRVNRIISQGCLPP